VESPETKAYRGADKRVSKRSGIKNEGLEELMG